MSRRARQDPELARYRRVMAVIVAASIVAITGNIYILCAVV